MTKLLTLALIGAISATAGASIPSKSKVSPLEKILSEKGDEKFDALKKLGPSAYKDLRNLTFNDNRAMPIRWQAFMAMVRLGERESLPEVRTALESRDWFLRDAALRVLPALDTKEAYNSSLSKLHDSALVVRQAAVDALGKIKNPNCADDLWAQLYSKDNYIHHQSLWIRRHIVETLAVVSPPGTEGRFIKVLDDSDSTLFLPAIRGLERLAHKKLGEESVPPVYRRFYWKKWYKDLLAKAH